MISYRDTVEEITSDRRYGLFVGCLNSHIEVTHPWLSRQSGAVVLAVDDETGDVVGGSAAITDGVLAA